MIKSSNPPLQLFTLIFDKRIIFLFVSLIVLLPFNLKSAPLQEDSGQIIQNITTQTSEDNIEISWNISYDAYYRLKSEGYSVYIKYHTKTGADNPDNSTHQGDWTTIKGIDIGRTKYLIQDLDGETEYVLKVGAGNGKQTYWSKTISATTKRGWGIFRLLMLIGSLGLFIYGMKVMSEGIQQAAGRKLRHLLGSITSNRFKGVITGFGITSIIQSSSVTTVMTVSFVNAGLLTLVQSAGVIMGANIGTTITGWIINIFGFNMDIASYVLIIIAIATPFMFFNRKPKLQATANALIGFALFFIGLEFLKSAVPTLQADSALIHFFVQYKDIPVMGTILFVILGTLVTIIVQSSSAAMALTMTLVAGGVLPFEVATAMILGENIGTTITAQFAAIVANVYAKRAAWIHTLFNLFGVCWAILFFPFFLKGIEWFMVDILSTGNPFTNPAEFANTGLAIFHTAFNLINVLALVWFAPFLVRMSEKIIKSKGQKDEEFRLDYISSSLITSPDLAFLEVKREVAKFGKITSKMSLFSREMLFEENKSNQRKLGEKIAKYEEITDRVEIEVANYLNKISEGRVSTETISRIRGMNSIVGDMERIGDIFFQISKSLEKKEEEEKSFSEKQKKNLNDMFDLIDRAFKIMCDNLNKHSSLVKLDEAYQVEDLINQKRNELRDEYLNNLSNDSDFPLEAGIIYQNIFASLERVGDHIINVSEGIVGKI